MKVKDPVCGMALDDRDAVGSAQHEGKTYYFCSQQCKATFQKRPEDFAGKS